MMNGSGSLSGKVALIVGAESAVGLAVGRQLAAAGAAVAGAVFSPGATGKRAKNRRNFTVFEVDLCNFAMCSTLIDSVEAKLGPIDIVVNCLDYGPPAEFKDMELETWQEVMNTNLDTVFNVTRHAVPRMLERGFGRIVNISSTGAQRGVREGTHYAAAKAGIHGFTMALAQEVARKGITVNTISPGHIANEVWSRLPEDLQNQIIAKIPAQRAGEPAEVAFLVEFLASDNAAYITGEDISLSGGQQLT